MIIGEPLPNLEEAGQLLAQTACGTFDFWRGKVRNYPVVGNLIACFYDAIRMDSHPPVDAAEGADVVRFNDRSWCAPGDSFSGVARTRAAGLKV